LTDDREVTSVEIPETSVDNTRRQFLGNAGRFAAVTPPAITLLLGTSLGSRAIAGSNGSKPHQWPGKGTGKGYGKGTGKGSGKGTGKGSGKGPH